MVNEILTELNIPFRETLFRKAPCGTYAVYHESVDRRGADTINLLKDIENTIELYSLAPDPDVEQRLEAILDEHSLEYEKQERVWIETEQLYQVIYDFTYTKKEG